MSQPLSHAIDRARHFDDMFVNNPDPWGYDSRWYEARKRALILGSLPRRRYRAGFEPGCANGALSDALAQRCDTFLASDASASALKWARVRLRSSPWVRIEQRGVPEQWPAGEKFDLIVLSEFVYYLGEPQFEQLIDCVRASLGESATVLACHWMGQAKDKQLTTTQVHARLGDALGLATVVHHAEPDFLLNVWSADALTVAQAEGIA